MALFFFYGLCVRRVYVQVHVVHPVCVGPCEMKKASPQTYQCATASFGSWMYLACNRHGLRLAFHMPHSTAVIFCLSIAVRFLPHRAVLCLYFVYWEFCETCDLTANIHALFLIMMHLNLNGTSLCWRHSSSVALLVSSLCLFHRYTDQQSFSSHFEFLATERLCI